MSKCSPSSCMCCVKSTQTNLPRQINHHKNNFPTKHTHLSQPNNVKDKNTKQGRKKTCFSYLKQDIWKNNCHTHTTHTHTHNYSYHHIILTKIHLLSTIPAISWTQSVPTGSIFLTTGLILFESGRTSMKYEQKNSSYRIKQKK